ncbi:MAG: bifunctional aldolase/short-chain dehydrogenase [Thermodesulfobacteriota bacterium]
MPDSYDKKAVKDLLAACPGLPRDLAACIHASRLLGGNPAMVLHGGGNTSVKLAGKDIFGRDQRILFIKGSGVDMAHIDPEGFAAMDLSALEKIRALDHLTDEEMENQLCRHRLDLKAPAPSVETLLHAFLPHRFVNHTHADAVLALTNRKKGKAVVQEALGAGVCVTAYEKSGLPLAKQVVAAWEKTPESDTVVVMYHGIFTFSDNAETACNRMIEHVQKAEKWLSAHQVSAVPGTVAAPSGGTCARVVQVIRGTCSPVDGSGKRRRLLASLRTDVDLVAISLSREARKICASGVLTPDHAIRTKNRIAFLPSVPGNDDSLRALAARVVSAYAEDYQTYLSANAGKQPPAGADPLPRVFLVAGLGLVALGPTRKAAAVAADIAAHTIRVKARCGMRNYRPIAENHVFDMEFWPFQQRKTASGPALPLEGQAALVTGAAGAIGFGVADRLLAAGAVVVAADLDETGLAHVCDLLAKRHGRDRVESVAFDVTDFGQTEQAFMKASLKTGGIDIVVPNAGIAHVATIENLEPAAFNRVVSVNLAGTFNTIKASVPVFRRQGTGGNIIVISTKNVFDPGAAFGAYSAAKAGAHQIAKIAAIELAPLGVRANMVNPDAVFGDAAVPSKLWELIGPDRMKARGLDPEGLKEYYRQRNLLKASVTAEHVGNVVVFFASDLSPTTGASFPVDGGNPAAFPR